MKERTGASFSSDSAMASQQDASRLSDLSILTKARLSLLVVFTTAIGYSVGKTADSGRLALFFAVLGTSLAAASAAALNQWMEADVDGLMERTRGRPLPGGRWTRGNVLSLGVCLGAAGVSLLWLTLPVLTALLAVATIVIYLLIYTPMKRRSSLCVLVGAVSGALPPVIGWAASGSGEHWAAWVPFGILFCWQMPHFLAIAWMYREEYRSAGFVMLAPRDEDGVFTASQALFFALTLAAVTFVPVWLEKAGTVYEIGAIFLNVCFSGSALVFLRERSRISARRLFIMSIIYLPLMLGLLAFFRT
ncbi:MAG: protoheme IX farnesyltransferase [Verrucomicrobia bacterium]|nr:protoheme IX farnesyltransferase [Verrucomicrobiota bacterium]